MSKRRSPRSAQAPEERAALRAAFDSHEEMAESLEALLAFLRRRTHQGAAAPQPSLVGFALERVRVEFSAAVRTIEVEARFAESIALVLLPARADETADERQGRLLAVIDRLLPSVKETQLRAVAQFYGLLAPLARERLVAAYHRQFKEAP